ncbi:hypothetical protein D3C81_2223280 [compost metagenome]
MNIDRHPFQKGGQRLQGAFGKMMAGDVFVHPGFGQQQRNEALRNQAFQGIADGLLRLQLQLVL